MVPATKTTDNAAAEATYIAYSPIEEETGRERDKQECGERERNRQPEDRRETRNPRACPGVGGGGPGSTYDSPDEKKRVDDALAHAAQCHRGEKASVL